MALAFLFTTVSLAQADMPHAQGGKSSRQKQIEKKKREKKEKEKKERAKR